MTAVRNLEPFVNGDDINIELRFDDDDGSHVNVVGDTLRLTLKDDISKDDSGAILQFVYIIPDNDFTKVGVVSFDIPSATTDIKAGTYHYDFQWEKTVSDLGKKVTPFIGKVKVLQGVTRA